MIVGHVPLMAGRYWADGLTPPPPLDVEPPLDPLELASAVIAPELDPELPPEPEPLLDPELLPLLDPELLPLLDPALLPLLDPELLPLLDPELLPLLDPELLPLLDPELLPLLDPELLPLLDPELLPLLDPEPDRCSIPRRRHRCRRPRGSARRGTQQDRHRPPQTGPIPR